ncbi:glutamate racemase [Oxalobacter vibrioformis]|uniref:Glutamate racemase n=1 Tax=Oxalobacter vibrioformis TaxID=933080 RepID=A0A9E9P4W0_9BURK|nr:glutamate racemase [Oxalobacter vibrioformis]WAW10516.1 glutamate racemase [Oxalobacter vibrioformis]
MNHTERPIGIFDSGIGGLSVLRHIREQLPDENLRYFADSGFAPYGEKPEELVIRRSMEIAHCLFSYDCKALVVACNTATAAAVHLLREKHPNIPIVGIEPGLKPAAAITRSKTVGVMATERTLQSSKFRKLHELLSRETGVRFIMQACPGLADLVEKNERHSAHAAALVRRYTLPLLEQNADTIVLGCTHYPFLQGAIENTLSESATETVNIIDTAIPVTRQLIRLLDQYNLKQTTATPESGVHALTTGDAGLLADQFEQLLHIRPDITPMKREFLPDSPERKT